MDSYKKEIEAIVRPLTALERRKNTFRRELWAHFCALLEDESRRESDSTIAANTALRRLGEPGELRATFLENLSRTERWLARWDRQPAEAPEHYALRVLWLALPLLILVPVCFGIQCTLAAPGYAVVPWAILLTLALWLPSYLFLALRKFAKWQSQLHRHRSVASFVRVYLLHAVSTAALTTAFVLAGFGCMAAWKGLDDGDTIAYLYMSPLVLAFQWFILTVVAAYVLVREADQAQIIPDWPYETDAALPKT